MSQSNWKKIKSWNVGTPDGNAETYTLYEDESTGCFRIQNDFGNVVIDMERMSGYEFLKRASGEIDAIINRNCSDDWFADIDFDGDSDEDTDCSSITLKGGKYGKYIQF